MIVDEFIQRLIFYKNRLEEACYAQTDEELMNYIIEANRLIYECDDVLKTIPNKNFLKSEIDRVEECLYQVKRYLPVRSDYTLQRSLSELDYAVRALIHRREVLQPTFNYYRNSQIEGLYNRTNELLQRAKADIEERGDEWIVEVVKSSKEDLKLEEQMIDDYTIIEDLQDSRLPQLSLIQLVNALTAQSECLRQVRNENNNG